MNSKSHIRSFVGILFYMGIGSCPAVAEQTAPMDIPENSAGITAGQKYCQSATFTTSSGSFVLVPSAVTVNNTSGSTKTALLRWTGVAAHLTANGYIHIRPARDGVVQSQVGQWFLGFDLDGDGVVSDTFGIQWPVSVPPGVHRLQPAIASSSSSFRNIDGYCFSAELNTK